MLIYLLILLFVPKDGDTLLFTPWGNSQLFITLVSGNIFALLMAIHDIKIGTSLKVIEPCSHAPIVFTSQDVNTSEVCSIAMGS